MDKSRVEVQFVGTGDAFGSGGRFQTCLSVRSANERFLIDCGASSLSALKVARVDPREVNTILVSHLHGDHFGGIPFFILDAQLVTRRTNALTIAGPPGLEERVRSAMEVLFPGSSTVKQKFDLHFVEIPPREERQIGGLCVTGFPVVHFSGAPSYALRVRFHGRIIVYSGDTEWTPSLIEAAAGADLFVCEAYYFDKVMKFHLDYQSLVAHRAELSCKRVILTHMNDDLLSQLHRVELDTAEDGMCISL